MLITHALQGQKQPKSETPKRKIKHIITTKTQILQPTTKTLTNPQPYIENKQNENPNIRKSPSSRSQQKPPSYQQSHYNPNPQPPVKQARIKSQYYTSNQYNNPSNHSTKQSPIKKILFVKNLSYNKSTKTSKNGSLDNKREGEITYAQEGKVGQHVGGKDVFERKSYSHYNSSKSLLENESEIYQEQRAMERPIQEMKTRDNMISNESQASYRMSNLPNELHTKQTQFNNEKYTATHRLTTYHQYISSPSMTSINSSQPFHHQQKPIKMCPNIESTDLSALESFKNKNYLFMGKKEPSMTKALISIIDKEKKESLSSKKKRNSRMKVNFAVDKNGNKYGQEEEKREYNREEGDRVENVNSQILASPGDQMFKENCSKASLGGNEPTTGSHNSIKSTNSKNFVDQSTLVETKKFEDDTFENPNQQFSKITLNESNQQIENQITQKPIAKHYCSNHSQKDAKFKVNKEVQKPYYCSKCTVLLVTQGYKVVENLQTKTNRLEKLKTFIFDLQIIQPKLQSFSTHLNRMQSEVMTLQSSSQQQIETYYKTIYTTLQAHKQTALKSLHSHTQKTLQQLQQMKKKLHVNERELGFMKADILPNVDLIVDEQRLPEQSWRQIISEHEHKMKNIKEIIGLMEKVVEGKGESKIATKCVQIPLSEMKSTLNCLERTQIVLTQKIVKLESLSLDMKGTFSPLHVKQVKLEENGSPTNMDQTKRSFSFDDDNIDTSFYLPSSKKKALHQSPSVVENIYQLSDSVRLSFGNKFDEGSSCKVVNSPTFKAI